MSPQEQAEARKRAEGKGREGKGSVEHSSTMRRRPRKRGEQNKQATTAKAHSESTQRKHTAITEKNQTLKNDIE